MCTRTYSHFCILNWSKYVCRDLSTYKYICVHIWTNAHVIHCVYLYMPLWKSPYLVRCTQTSRCVFTCVSLCVRACVRVCVCVCAGAWMTRMVRLLSNCFAWDFTQELFRLHVPLNFSYSRRARAMSHMNSFTLDLHDMNSLIRWYTLQFHTRILSGYTSHSTSVTVDEHAPCHTCNHLL